MALRTLHQVTKFELSRAGCVYCNEIRAKNKTTCGIHQRDAVKISIFIGSNWCRVETKRYPSLVNFEIVGMKHANTYQVPPNARNSGRPKAGPALAQQVRTACACMDDSVAKRVK